MASSPVGAAAAAAAAAAAEAEAPPPQAPTPADGFDGRTVLITGAGGNFGRAGAEYFARAGANVVLSDMAGPMLDDAAAAVAPLLRAGRRSVAVACDVTDHEAVQRLVSEVAAAFGELHHLWNNAGYQGAMRPAAEYPVEDFAKVMDVNVVGAFSVLQAAAQLMIAKGTRGSIVNTASVAALRGTPTMCAYVASKAALIGLTVSTAKDLAPFGIRVNAVSPALIGPGTMWTRQNDLHAASGSPYFDRDSEKVAAAKVASVPLKRLGTIDEVVQSVAFLLSDASSYTTGHNLVISGGLA